jgi:hypothetical protein
MDQPGSRLCLSCGLCCDGTLFELARAKPDERPHLQDLGLGYIEDSDGRTGFRQPCPAFEGCCSVYEARPSVCRRFRCNLLAKVIEGALPIEEAEGIVETAKGLVRRGEPLGVDLSTLTARKRIREAGPAAAPRAYLEAVAVGTFLERHFTKAKADDPSGPAQPSA